MNVATPLHPLRAWNRFWFAPVSARPLGAFRIAFGLIALAHVALLWPDAHLWLSNEGYLQGSEAAELAGALRWSPLQVWHSPPVIDATLAATAVVSVLFALGWHTRVMGVLLYAGLLAIHHRNLMTASGADVLLVIIAFWMMLSPAGKALSLDRRRQQRKGEAPADSLIWPWTQRMIQIQVSIVYLVTGLLKASGGTWANGTALYYVLANREMRRWTFGLLEHVELINLLTFASVVIEVALAFLLWSRAARRWIIPLGIALHAGIGLTVNIPIFGELMVASYLVFLTPQELGVVGKLFRLGRTRPAAEPAASDRPEHQTKRETRRDQAHHGVDRPSGDAVPQRDGAGARALDRDGGQAAADAADGHPRSFADATFPTGISELIHHEDARPVVLHDAATPGPAKHPRVRRARAWK